MSTLEEILAVKQASWRGRHEAYKDQLNRFATLLDAATDDNPVARAVCDLHHFEEARFGELQCTECLQYDDEGKPWPCDTITAVAVALSVEVPTL